MNEGLLVRHFLFHFAWLHSANWSYQSQSISAKEFMHARTVSLNKLVVVVVVVVVIIWWRSPKWPKATRFLGGPGACSPGNFLKMNMRWDAIWYILRHNFEKCYNVCTDLVATGWFFRYSYLYTVKITIFWGESLVFFFGGGGASTPQLPALDRTLAVWGSVTGWGYIFIRVTRTE